MRAAHLSSLGLIILAAGVACGQPMTNAQGDLARALPADEVTILSLVARDYGLEGDKFKLLLAIRKVENGGPGVEMGVASDYPRHRARRHAGNPAKSLRVQAQWAAGTIRRHYTGDLDAFAKRYCPPKWEHWRNLVTHWMKRG